MGADHWNPVCRLLEERCRTERSGTQTLDLPLLESWTELRKRGKREWRGEEGCRDSGLGSSASTSQRSSASTSQRSSETSSLRSTSKKNSVGSFGEWGSQLWGQGTQLGSCRWRPHYSFPEPTEAKKGKEGERGSVVCKIQRCLARLKYCMFYVSAWKISTKIKNKPIYF